MSIINSRGGCRYTPYTPPGYGPDEMISFHYIQLKDTEMQTSQLSLFGSETQDFERNLKISLQSHQISLFHKNISRFQAKSQDFSLRPQILTINSLYTLLFRMAEVVLKIPHSKAAEEHIFSLISKNKTPSGSSLNLDVTLSSLVTDKI